MVLKLKNKTLQHYHHSGVWPSSDSTDEDLEKFYEAVDTAYKQCGSQDIRIVILNAKIGKQQKDDEDTVDRFGLEERNE